MAKVNSNTYVTPSNSLIKEDVADKIWNISPQKTPVSSHIGTTPIQSRTPVWHQDKYRAPKADNKSEPGFKATATAQTAPTKLGNYAQIMSDTISVDDAMENSAIYGNFNKLAYLAAKKAVELKRDVEATVISSQASIAPADGTAGQSAGFGSIIKSNIDKASGGSVPGYQNNGTTTARTKGTTRTVTEQMFTDVLSKRYVATGEDTDSLNCYVSMPMKQKLVSVLTGRNIDRVSGDGKVVNGTVDIYTSPAGQIKILPHYMQADEQILIVDSQKASVGVFRNFQTKDLAKTGDATDRLILSECALIVNDEEAHAAIYDVKV